MIFEMFIKYTNYIKHICYLKNYENNKLIRSNLKNTYKN